MAHIPDDEPPKDLWPEEGPLGDGFPAPEPHPKPNGSHGPNGHAPELGADTPAEAEAPEGSEDAFATAFVEQYGETHRFVARWGQWYQWDGARWRHDDTLHVFDRAKLVIRAEITKANAKGNQPPGKGKGSASLKTARGVEGFAKADRTIAATIDQWDADPWLLNTPTGIVDLKTGRVGPHDPLAYMIKSTAVGPADTEDCPIWLQFIKTITNDSPEVSFYLQRSMGYCLTGVTTEQALFFFYGTGGNGKGVFINTVRAVLKDYATVTSPETFTVNKNPRHPTELAALRGARMVTAQETESTDRWAESRIKALTGGDPISARFIAKDPFEFIPQFKLVIAGNHKPALRTVDAAISRRMNLVPFTVSIPKEEQDPELSEKLKPEHPAILRWMINGCIDWQEGGLQPPAIVREATIDYLGAEDAFGQWLDECCVRSSGSWTASGDLFQSLKKFMEDNGERAISAKRLAQELESRGFKKKRGGHGGKPGFDGIRVQVTAQRDFEDD